MTTKEVVPIDPLPIKEENLRLNQDFCASIVDPGINHRDVTLTGSPSGSTNPTEEEEVHEDP